MQSKPSGTSTWVEEFGSILGFTAPRIKARVLNASVAVEEVHAKALYANSMSIPHVGTVLLSCLAVLEDVFVLKEQAHQ